MKMDDKTTEERLRQALEGNFSWGSPNDNAPATRTINRSRTRDRQNISERGGTLTSDLERRIEHSLDTANIIRPSHERSGRARINKSRVVKANVPDERTRDITAQDFRKDNSDEKILPEAPEQPQDISQAEPVHDEANANDEVHEVVTDKESSDESTTQHAGHDEIDTQDTVSIDGTESLSEQNGNSRQDFTEIASPDTQVLSEHEGSNNLATPDELSTLDMTEIEAEQQRDTDLEELTNTHDITEPSTEYVSHDDNSQQHTDQDEYLPDIPIIDQNTDLPEIEDSDDNLPDIPVIALDEHEGTQDDNIITPDSDDNTEDLLVPDEDIDEIVDAPAIDAEEVNTLDNNTSHEELQDFLPTADVVLNIDEDLPQVNDEIPEPDPESESSPISVTMPESTKTAEDKLMADIAEAMTGSPLNLDMPDTSEPYKLPEDFLNRPDNNEQSAEDKLIANIAQAISESPLDIAQNNVVQDLEKDLNPFEELSLSELAENFSQEDPEPEDEPFLQNFSDDDQEPEAEPELENFVDTPDTEPEQPEPDENLDILPDDNAPVQENIDEEIPTPEPLTEQQKLEQEVAKFSQQNTNTELTPENIDYSDNIEEVSTDNNMPEQNLLEDEDISNINPEIGDDDVDEEWDISSLGELSEVTSIIDDTPEPEPELAPENVNAGLSTIINQDEEREKEKTMGIREKLSRRKSTDTQDTPSTPKKSSHSPRGGLLMPLLLGLLLIVGVLTLFQLKQLSDRITAGLMNSGSLEGVSVTDNLPSYEYAIDFILDPNISESMALRGRAGWQVVGSRRTQDSTSGQYGYEFIFMRRVQGR